MKSLHPSQWLKTDESGLYCQPLDAYIDPMTPVPQAIITHGHADHARPGHGKVYATQQTLDIMRIRYGDDFCDEPRPLNYHQSIDVGKGQLFFASAGHILGSAQAVIDAYDHRLVISGDYKRHFDPTCEPFDVVSCDVFVSEATFGLPVFSHPPIEQQVQKLLDSLGLFPQRCHLVGVYALGKCQRVIKALRGLGYNKPIFMHGALINLCEYYQSQGIELDELVPVSSVENMKSLTGEIVLAPPSALNDRWSRKLPNIMTSMASGWMQIRARSKQRRAELPLIISDHADWNELITTLKEVNPDELWVTHGREEALVHQATSLGYKAKALSLVGYDEDANA